MADKEVIALLDHIKDVAERMEKKLDDHIEKDEIVKREFILPLWNESQQRVGAAKLGAVLYTVIGGSIVGIIDFFSKAH